MVDDTTKIAPLDRKLISMSEDYEVAYWAKKFGVSKERLAEAVRRVGHAAAAVQAELKN